MQVIKKLREALTYSRVEKVPYGYVKEVARKAISQVAMSHITGISSVAEMMLSGDPVVLDTAEELPGLPWLSLRNNRFATTDHGDSSRILFKQKVFPMLVLIVRIGAGNKSLCEDIVEEGILEADRLELPRSAFVSSV